MYDVHSVHFYARVKLALRLLAMRSRDLGLTLNRGKCSCIEQID